MEKEASCGHFDLCTAEDLYKKAVHDYLHFFYQPNSWTLFNLLAAFTHLLEWICPEANGKPPRPEYAQGTYQQQFYFKQWNQDSYQKIRLLCNNSKHFQSRKDGPITSVVEGSEVGLLQTGDSLNQTYYTVNGEDIRDILVDVYKSFKEYFETACKR